LDSVRSAAVQQARQVFDRNRAVGRLVLGVDAAAGSSRRRRVEEQGSLRLRFPHTDAAELEAVIINTAGGIAGGDRLDIEVSVADDARLVVTTAAAEKIYRASGPEATIAVKLEVGAAAALCWLPQETILFDRARLSRRIDVALADDASLVLAEALVLGRTAMGEAVSHGQFVDRWRIWRGGRLVFAETMRLDGPIAQMLAEPAIAGGGAALAAVVLVPGDERQTTTVRGLGDRLAGEVGISSWNGLAVARLCARDGATLRRDLVAVLTAVMDRPLPRLWLN
jgi:urease accessory protein